MRSTGLSRSANSMTAMLSTAAWNPSMLYLKTQASQDIRRKANAVFCRFAKILVSNLAIVRSLAFGLAEDPPDEARKHLPRYPQVSATLIGRLAVASELQGPRPRRHPIGAGVAQSLRERRRRRFLHGRRRRHRRTCSRLLSRPRLHPVARIDAIGPAHEDHRGLTAEPILNVAVVARHDIHRACFERPDPCSTLGRGSSACRARINHTGADDPEDAALIQNPLQRVKVTETVWRMASACFIGGGPDSDVRRPARVSGRKTLAPGLSLGTSSASLQRPARFSGLKNYSRTREPHREREKSACARKMRRFHSIS